MMVNILVARYKHIPRNSIAHSVRCKEYLQDEKFSSISDSLCGSNMFVYDSDGMYYIYIVNFSGDHYTHPVFYLDKI